MMVKTVSFERNQLKHTNYKNGYHIYDSMTTVSDKADNKIPDSVISLLYRIYQEKVTAEQSSDESEGSADMKAGDAA